MYSGWQAVVTESPLGDHGLGLYLQLRHLRGERLCDLICLLNLREVWKMRMDDVDKKGIEFVRGLTS